MRNLVTKFTSLRTFEGNVENICGCFTTRGRVNQWTFLTIEKLLSCHFAPLAARSTLDSSGLSVFKTNDSSLRLFLMATQMRRGVWSLIRQLLRFF